MRCTGGDGTVTAGRSTSAGARDNDRSRRRARTKPRPSCIAAMPPRARRRTQAHARRPTMCGRPMQPRSDPTRPRSSHTAIYRTPAGTHDMAASLHPRMRPALTRRASQQSDSQRACRHAPHKTRRCPPTARRPPLKTHHPPVWRRPATLQLQRRLLIQIIRRKRHHETLSHNELNQAGALADHSISRRHRPANTHGAAAPREAPGQPVAKGVYCGPNSRSAWLSPAD